MSAAEHKRVVTAAQRKRMAPPIERKTEAMTNVLEKRVENLRQTIMKHCRRREYIIEKFDLLNPALWDDDHQSKAKGGQSAKAKSKSPRPHRPRPASAKGPKQQGWLNDARFDADDDDSPVEAKDSHHAKAEPKKSPRPASAKAPTAVT